MLGSLTRWLRILGFDVAYDPELEDAELVERAVSENRVILTRDSRLIERRKARDHLFVASDRLEEQLRQVITEIPLDVAGVRLFGRCLRCNEPLEDLPAKEVLPLVPPYVARTQRRFRRCPTCQRIYWRATHVERMLAKLGAMGVNLDA